MAPIRINIVAAELETAPGCRIRRRSDGRGERSQSTNAANVQAAGRGET